METAHGIEYLVNNEWDQEWESMGQKLLSFIINLWLLFDILNYMYFYEIGIFQGGKSGVQHDISNLIKKIDFRLM